MKRYLDVLITADLILTHIDSPSAYWGRDPVELDERTLPIVVAVYALETNVATLALKMAVTIYNLEMVVTIYTLDIAVTI